jgi:hypothetical protein
MIGDRPLGCRDGSACKTFGCNRDVRPSESASSHPVYCCHACGLAHLGGYAIEDGPLAHSIACERRQITRNRVKVGDQITVEIPIRIVGIRSQPDLTFLIGEAEDGSLVMFGESAPRAISWNGLEVRRPTIRRITWGQ